MGDFSDNCSGQEGGVPPPQLHLGHESRGRSPWAEVCRPPDTISRNAKAASLHLHFDLSQNSFLLFLFSDFCNNCFCFIFMLIPLNSPLKLFITEKDFTVEFIIEPLFSQQLSSNSRHHPYGRISGIINITSITVILITHKHLRGKFGQHRNGPFHARKREWCLLGE